MENAKYALDQTSLSENFTHHKVIFKTPEQLDSDQL